MGSSATKSIAAIAPPADAGPVPADARAALHALMRDHGATLYGFCRRVVGEPALAADVHQQVFEQAFRDYAKLEDPQRARAWLFGIAHHRCLDAVKARRRRDQRFASDEGVEEAAVVHPDPAATIDAGAITAALEDCIQSLSAEVRMAVLLRFQEGMLYEEMGRLCDEKPATLQARVMRALPALRRCLEAKGIEP